ncbi:hypothetical protein amrb99_24760 [Actinomadura sp. RB99]|uniref:hypothetical protein n=1 Tax=Actinomadura sp. RB99 TaxID=2691577 RepID=UPI001683A098|nr:hypothetical protein [Actinomadura sp. RB99]MBD2893554.1 hypothetical protein [Actinomadura sp. RB99]
MTANTPDLDSVLSAAIVEGRIGPGEHPTGGVPVRPKSYYADERPAYAWNQDMVSFRALDDADAE